MLGFYIYENDVLPFLDLKMAACSFYFLVLCALLISLSKRFLEYYIYFCAK